MNDYFDAFEQELKAAVPRAARSHKRGRNLARLPLFRLGSLLLLIVLGLAPALGLTGGLSHAGDQRPAAQQKRHHQAPHQPNEITLLKGLVALRRRIEITNVQARIAERTMRTIRSGPVSSLLRFAAGTAAVGIQSVLISTRRRSKDPPHAPATSLLHPVSADPERCGARRRAPTAQLLHVGHNTSRGRVCALTTTLQQTRSPGAPSHQTIRRRCPASTPNSAAGTTSTRPPVRLRAGSTACLVPHSRCELASPAYSTRFTILAAADAHTCRVDRPEFLRLAHRDAAHPRPTL